jgi:DNA helicase II / ATP-dependent DNA helicase PcrA
MDLVKAVADEANLELWSLEPANVLLNGALAVLARLDGAIYHANNLSPEELAALVAHELGHFHIHTLECATRCARDDVDVSAPNEASPVGADRVVGYGAKERRELQANVFARELLLPQPKARSLYLELAKTPTSIATDFGLPLAVTRQQLIDAVLIPSVSILKETEETQDLALDPSQTVAAEFTDAPLLLEAGPGTGKTRTLVARIVHLVKKDVDPTSIVALTFSNKAAQEISDRVSAVLPEAAANIWTGTFHAFGLELVRKHYDHPHLDYPPEVGIIDKSEAVALLEEVLPLLNLRHYKNLWDPLVYLKDILGAISRAKDELISPHRYRQLGQEMLDKAPDVETVSAAEKALEVAEVYEQYEKRLAEFNLLDFGDLIMKPTLMLEQDVVLRDTLRMQYRHILVDEYQDVNRASAHLLKAIAGNGEQLWVVGDPRQSIYRFRGASSANMARFDVDFPGAKRLSLAQNYRSAQEIVNAYCGFSRSMDASTGMLPLQLNAQGGTSGIVPEIRQVDNEEAEEAAAAASILELEKAGVSFGSQAMLFRTNSRLSQFAAALELRGIPVLHLGSLFEREEIRDLLSILSFIADPLGSALVRLAALKTYQIPLADVLLFLEQRHEAESRALEALKSTGDLEGLSTAGKNGFSALAVDLDGFSLSSSPWDVLCTYLFDRSRQLKPLIESTDVRDQMKCLALWQFLNFVREPQIRGKGPPIYRLLERIRHLVVLGDERDLRQIPSSARHANAVRMLTMHGSKGLEFAAVHIPGMTKGQVPLTYRGVRCPPPDGMVDEAGITSGREYAKAIHAAEEECLYFVAMSRARLHLRHYGNSTKPSAFISNVTPPLSMVRNVPLSPKPSGATRDWILPVTSPPLGLLDADELSRYDTCPRRFLYTYVLGLAGRQRATPFVKAHDCVYETIRLAREHNRREKEWLLEQLNTVWQERGPLDHAYVEDYRKIAQQTIENFHSACEGLNFQELETLVIDLAHGKVEVNPDQIARRSDGTMLLRRIRTGKVSDDEEGEWIYTFYHEAATERYGPGRYEIEAVHLTSNTRTKIDPSLKRRNNRMEKAAAASKNIYAGAFPPQPDVFSCPRCPHFFYCPSLPEGMVQLP